MSYTDTTIRTPSADIRVRQSGGGYFPVLMLHGSGASKEVFAHQFAHPLAERFRLIAIDLPGHGQSSDASDPAAYGLQQMAGIVGEVIDALGLEQVAVFGWSLGGHIAIELLDRHAAICGVMLTGCPPVAKGMLGMLRGFQTRWDMLLASKPNFSERDAERFGRLCFGAALTPELLSGIMRADGRARVNFMKSMTRGEGADQKQVIETTMVPVAMVSGASEPIVRPGYLTSLAYRSLWEGYCHIVEDAGHAPFLQAPDTFNRLLARFAAHTAMTRVAPVTMTDSKAAG